MASNKPKAEAKPVKIVELPTLSKDVIIKKFQAGTASRDDYEAIFNEDCPV